MNGSTILIADPNPDVIGFIKLLLKKRNFKIIIAKSSAEMHSILISYKPKLIIADASMAGYSALDLIDRIQSLNLSTKIIELRAFYAHEAINRIDDEKRVKPDAIVRKEEMLESLELVVLALQK